MEVQHKIELIKVAINDFIVIQNYIGDRKDTAKSFRARCREVPSLIDSIGLVPTLSFCYAKAGKKEYTRVVNEINKTQKRGGSGDKGSVEEGYAIYLYFILKTIRSLGFIGDVEVNNPIEALKKILDNERIVASIIRPYMIQLKRLAEAIFEE